MAKERSFDYKISVDDQGTPVFERFKNVVVQDSKQVQEALNKASVSMVDIKTNMAAIQAQRDKSVVGSKEWARANADLEVHGNLLRELKTKSGDYAGQTNTLTEFIRKQRTEQREQNFLFKQGRDAIGATALGLSILSQAQGGADSSTKKLTNSLNEGFLMFQGLSFILAGTGPWGVAIAGAIGAGTAIYKMGAQSEEAKKKIHDLDGEIIALKVHLGELPRESQAEFLAKDYAKAVTEAQKGNEIVLDVVKSFAMKTLMYKTRASEEEQKELDKNAAKKKTAMVDFENVATKSTEAVTKADIESQKIRALAHVTNAIERIQIERKYGLAAIDEEERVKLASEQEQFKRTQITNEATASRNKLEAESANKIIEENRRIKDAIEKLEADRLKIISDTNKAELLFRTRNAMERIQIEHKAAIDEANIEQQKEEKTAQGLDAMVEVFKKYEAKREQIRSGSTLKIAAEEERVQQAVGNSSKETEKIYLELEKQKVLATEDSATRRIAINTEFMLRDLEMDRKAADEKSRIQGKSDEERAADARKFEARKQQIITDGAINERQTVLEESEKTWGGYKEIASRSLADVFRVMINTNARREQIDTVSLRKKHQNEITDIQRRDALGRIEDKRERQRLDNQLNAGEISREEYQLRIAEMESQATDRRDAIATKESEQLKALNEAYEQNSQASLSNIEIIWGQFWENVVDNAIDELARLAVFKVFGSVFSFLTGGISSIFSGIAGSAGSEVAASATGNIPQFAHTGGSVTDDGKIQRFQEGSIPEKYKGFFIDASPVQEFMIKVRGGETIRTEKQEKEIREKIIMAQKILSKAPKFHDGGAVGHSHGEQNRSEFGNDLGLILSSIVTGNPIMGFYGVLMGIVELLSGEQGGINPQKFKEAQMLTPYGSQSLRGVNHTIWDAMEYNQAVNAGGFKEGTFAPLRHRIQENQERRGEGITAQQWRDIQARDPYRSETMMSYFENQRMPLQSNERSNISTTNSPVSNTSNQNTERNATTYLTINVNGPVSSPQAFKEILQEGMRLAGVTDINKFIINNRSTLSLE